MKFHLNDLLSPPRLCEVSRGSIPVGFYACMFLDEGQPLYLETRFGGWDNAQPVGPQFQISWRADKEVIPPLDTMSDGWYKVQLACLLALFISFGTASRSFLSLK